MPQATEKDESKTERGQQILDAASKCFARNGFHGTSMNELAREAGMSVGHIYHYFEGKEAIIAAIVRREVARQLERFDELRQDTDVVEGLLQRTAPALARRLDRQQAALWLEVLAESSRNPQVAAVVHAADETLRRTYRDAIAPLGIRLGVSLDELSARVEVLIALFEGMSIRAVRHPGLERDPLLAMLKLAIRTLLTEPPTPHP
jgi:AcrR family transcriptional regulator